MKKRITGTWPLTVVWIVVLSAVLLLGWSNMMERTHFYGIADSREITINSANPVEVENIHVVEGESVKPGQQLVQLRNPELTLKINQIAYQLDQLKAQKDVDKTQIIATIAQLNAQKTAQIHEAEHRIQELENAYAINTSLASGLKSVTSAYLNTSNKNNSHPILLQIERRKQELSAAVKLLDIQLNFQNRALNAADKPIGIQINQLENELTLLRSEKSKLAICSTIFGVIGSVYYKAGEKVTPFAPIITLYAKTPSIIKGYLREDEYSPVKVGDKLSITSQTNAGRQINGSVVGIGARIVQYPARLQKYQDIQAWGREITIKIPEINDFILGEKVIIGLETANKPFWSQLTSAILPHDTIAGSPSPYESLIPDSPEQIENPILPVIPLNHHALEASAILYLPDLDQYLLASDDTPGQKLLLYLMDHSGHITREMNIADSTEIDDIESMTSDTDGLIYIAASLSRKKNGTAPPLARRLLISLKRNGKFEFCLDKRVDLLSLLSECARSNPNVPWARFLLHSLQKGDTDVEGMFWHENALFLGFKSPFFKARSVILKISQIDRLLEHQNLIIDQVGIWKTLNLHTGDFRNPERISDLYYHTGVLFITAVQETIKKRDSSGSLWRYDLKKERLERIAHFQNLKPEGVAATNDVSSLLVCFDQGKKFQSQITLVREIQ